MTAQTSWCLPSQHVRDTAHFKHWPNGRAPELPATTKYGRVPRGNLHCGAHGRHRALAAPFFPSRSPVHVAPALACRTPPPLPHCPPSSVSPAPALLSDHTLPATALGTCYALPAMPSPRHSRPPPSQASHSPPPWTSLPSQCRSPGLTCDVLLSRSLILSFTSLISEVIL